jgi:hypothetical protein
LRLHGIITKAYSRISKSIFVFSVQIKTHSAAPTLLLST